MKRIALLVAVLSFVVLARSGGSTKRPKILGIGGVRISVSDLNAARKFYSGTTGFDMSCQWCETSQRRSAILPSGQVLEIVSGDGSVHPNMVIEITLVVDDLQALRQLLVANKVPFQESGEGPPSIQVRDPEGHGLRFIPPLLAVRPRLIGQESGPSNLTENAVVRRLIHAGFVVRDRAAMDKFYKDILGFHVYWSGGMKEGETDWVDVQVPDGTDWIEYMLNVGPNPDKHTLGVMNHIALGVPDVRAAANQLEKNGVQLPEQPKIGRDGKWQLNLYDPDGTRVELMEFTPA